MARPTPATISSGLAAWDGEVDDNFGLIFSTPLPLAIYASFAALPAAASYDNCIAVITDEDVMCISDGTNWQRFSPGSPPTYANFAGLPAAGAGNVDQIAVIQDLDLLVISDGSAWKIIGTQAADITAFTGSPGGAATDTLALSLVTARTAPTVGTAGNHADIVQPSARTGGPGGTAGNYSTVTDPADTPATADALRDDLVANTIAELRDNQTTLATDMAVVRTAIGVIMDSIRTLAEQMLEITNTGGLQLDARDNLQALTTKVNLIRTNLRATGLMA